jgi:formylglycine-generating enzyme required for sulfatase activity
VRAGRGASLTTYPWGNEFFAPDAPPRGNFGERPSTGHPYYSTVPEDAAWPRDGYRGLAPPCQFAAGASPYGVCDLVGSLGEWLSGVDATKTGLMLKGGNWFEGEAESFRLGTRSYATPEMHRVPLGGYAAGFRCAKPQR